VLLKVVLVVELVMFDTEIGVKVEILLDEGTLRENIRYIF
jgi:hypothetical protein